MKSTTPVSVMIVGSEGSGKTVLAAVLADFVTRNRQCGLQFRDEDFHTKGYCDDVMADIRAGRWPESTRQANKPNTLRWKWAIGEGPTHRQWHEVTLIDPSGHDIREEMTGRSAELGIVGSVDDARILILTVDLEGYCRSSRATKAEEDSSHATRAEEEWIVERVIQSFSRECNYKNLVIVLTKADALPASWLSEDEWSNRAAVIRLLRERMPNCKLDSYIDELWHKNCEVVAVAAVKAQTRITSEQQGDSNADGQTGGRRIRMPEVPHKSGGLPLLVDKLVHALKAAQARQESGPVSVETIMQYMYRIKSKLQAAAGDLRARTRRPLGRSPGDDRQRPSGT